MDGTRRLADWKAGRLSLCFVAIALIVSFGLRCGWITRASVEHFDEGVYAGDALLGFLRLGSYPAVEFFAPPLFPWLVGEVLPFADRDSTALFLIPIFAGFATVILAWRISWRACGPAGAGLTLLVATFSDPHVLFSRTLLTDVPAVLFWLFALNAYSRSLLSGELRWSLIAAVAVAAAWATKYTGWAVLANCLAGGGLWLVLLHDRSRFRKPVWKSLLLVGLTGLLWSPVWFDLQDVGGYSAIAENHSGYVTDSGGWGRNLWIQARMLSALDSSLGLVGLLLMTVILGYRFTWNGHFSRGVVFLFAGSLAALLACGPTVTVILLGLVGCIRMLLSSEASQERCKLWGSLLLVMMIGMMIGLGTYHPYPRLCLPLVVASWIGVGGLLIRMKDPTEPRQQAWNHSIHTLRSDLEPWPGRILWLGSLGVILVCIVQADGIPAWEDRHGLGRAVVALVNEASVQHPDESRGEPLCLTYAEPAAFFHLLRAGRQAIPLAGRDQLRELVKTREEVWLIMNERMVRDWSLPDPRSSLPEIVIEEMARQRYQPSTILLCNLDPTLAWRDPGSELSGTQLDSRRQLEMVLYRCRRADD